jgi:4'-phosphopantetheinyl transferase EntD
MLLREHSLEQVLQAGLPGRLAVAAEHIPLTGGGGAADLFPIEAAAIAAAVPARKAEFAAGRAAARRAMEGLGCAACAIPVASDRAPVWPENVRGSLSHAGDLAVAIVGRARDFQAIGLDMEPDEDLPLDLLSSVLTAAERAAVAQHADGLRAARRVFCAKEAVFKALYPGLRRFVGFDAAQMPILPPARGVANVDLGPDFGPEWDGCELQVRFETVSGMMIAVVLVGAPHEQKVETE